MLATAAVADPRLWARYLHHVRAARDPMAAAFAVGLGAFQDRAAYPRVAALLVDRRLDASLRRELLASAFANPTLRERRRDLAGVAAPLLSADDLADALDGWCGADDETAAAELLRARGADASQVERVGEAIRRCPAPTGT